MHNLPKLKSQALLLHHSWIESKKIITSAQRLLSLRLLHLFQSQNHCLRQANLSSVPMERHTPRCRRLSVNWWVRFTRSFPRSFLMKECAIPS